MIFFLLSVCIHSFDFDLVSEWQRTHFHSADVGKTIDSVPYCILIEWFTGISGNCKTERQKVYWSKNKYSLFLAVMVPSARHELILSYLTLSVTPNAEMVLKMFHEFPTTCLDISINYHYVGSHGTIIFSFDVKFHPLTLYWKLVSVPH